MPTAAELKELATPLIDHLASLEAAVTAAQANYDRLTRSSDEILANLRKQALVEARDQHAREVADEKAKQAAEREQLQQDRTAASKDRAETAAALAQIHAKADQMVAAKIAAAHAAARQAMQD